MKNYIFILEMRLTIKRKFIFFFRRKPKVITDRRNISVAMGNYEYMCIEAKKKFIAETKLIPQKIKNLVQHDENKLQLVMQNILVIDYCRQL